MQVPSISVIFKDENFIAVNKPAGLLIHGAKNAEQPALVDWLLKKYPEVKKVGDNPEERPGIVHRLDRDTSGIVLVALNQNFFEYLKKLFQEHLIKKTYLALVSGKLKEKTGVIKKPIGIKSNTVKRTVHSGKMSKEAVTEFKALKIFQVGDEFFTLLKVIPKTGRTHQIRVHLASIGCPIIGDRLYGGKDVLFSERQFLHAESVEFNLARGKKIKIAADLPDDLKKVILNLENASGNSQKNKDRR